MKSRPVTLTDLARESGVSIRTVCRILKGEAYVREDKRARVLELAAKYSYAPNMAARNLRLQKKQFVGILCASLDFEIIVRKLHEFEDALTRAGYYPILGPLENSSEESFRNMILAWSGTVEAVVVFSTANVVLPRCVFEQGMLRNPRFLFADCLGPENASSVLLDRAAGVRDAAESLLRQGRRSFLFCGTQGGKADGITAAFAAFPEISAEEQRMSLPVFSFDGGYQAAPEILKRAPDAVFFENDRTAAGFLKYAAEHKVRVPEKIAVVGYDDDSLCRMLTPSLSSVEQPVREISDRLIELIAHPETEGNIVLPTRFVPRASTGGVC